MKDTSKYKQIITLPIQKEADWRDTIPREATNYMRGDIELDCGDWLLNYRDIKLLRNILRKAGLQIKTIKSNHNTMTIKDLEFQGENVKLICSNKGNSLQILVEDKLSMANSLETRIPYLDNDLVVMPVCSEIRVSCENWSTL